MNRNKWVTFYFGGNLWFQYVDSREKWQELVGIYSANQIDCNSLLECKNDLDSKKLHISFGMTPQHDGSLTLGEWAKENGIDLTVSK